MTSTDVICPQCRKKAKKYGPPELHGHFLDQIFNCTDCDWCGVETEVLDRPGEWQGVPVQGELFREGFDNGGDL